MTFPHYVPPASAPPDFGNQPLPSLPDIQTWPHYVPPAVAPPDFGNQPLPGTGPSSTVVVQTGGTQPFLPAALKWLGALALLWIILTALTEYSPNMRQLGIGFAGLILVGALYYLGPQAIANVKHLWE